MWIDKTYKKNENRTDRKIEKLKFFYWIILVLDLNSETYSK